ncbi:PDZ and LIM domain protein 7 [Fasciola gigantica]|uniref:PDZ and LIM domain protein 7 n=1 Tax=Fasciola gigantica TaxID=46835 RepID=A0A504YDZ8_FASGI|nr:PDZ and LIM domain protein 7 [Fasciola gigantica]
MRRSVNITRPDPSITWGFRIQGGRDFGQQLRIASVTPGGLAERYGIQAGDQVVTIGGDSTVSMTHQQAQQAVIRCCNELEMEVVSSSHVHSTKSEVTPHNEWIQTASVPHAYAPKAQSTVNINLHKPNPVGHSPSDAAGYRANGGYSLDSYAPQPYKPPSARQSDRIEPTQTPSLNETVSFTRPTYSSQPSTVPLRSGLYKPSVDKNLTTGGAIHNPNSSGVLQGMKAATIQPQNTRRHPICHYCKSPILGPFVDAVDYCFCPEHFLCFTCRVPLKDRYFAQEDGKFYCQEDFMQNVASKCAKCGSPIIGIITKALDKSWHPHCFVCCYCKRPLRDKFHVEDADQVLCEEHWQQLHLTECAKCKQSISEIDRFIEAFGKQYHAKCFCCAACQCPLEGKPFHSRDNKPFCRAHANAAAIFG